MSALVYVLVWILVPTITYAALQFPKILQMVAQLLVDASHLEISSISIGDCQEDSFSMTMTSRISNTGPFPALIDGMTVSLFSEMPGGQYTESPGTRSNTSKGSVNSSSLSAFATVQLPALQISAAGVECNVSQQRVYIKNQRMFHIFNRNLINHNELPLYLRASGTIHVFGMSCGIQYVKQVTLKGMEGIHITVLQTRKAGGQWLSGPPGAVQVDVDIENKSCVTMEMGTVHVNIHKDNIVIGDLHADMLLRPGFNRVTFEGSLKLSNMIKNPKFGASFVRKDLKGESIEALVIGERGEQTRWINGVVKEIKSPITLDSTLRDIYKSVQ